MNYLDTVNWMFKQLPMYQNQGKSAYKTDLSNTLRLADHLNHPQHKFKSIHVAGTNGKGSTSHMLASVLQEAGYKVGLYTSPHLKDFRERIKIDGKQISKQFVIGFIERNFSFFESNKLSFFEMTVGMAFDYFARKKVDIAVIEVGLGGRLDSTNIVTPEISVITNIGFDHMQFLGDTYDAIAREKAGIIKPKIPVVIGETQIETENVFLNIASLNNSEIYFADQCNLPLYKSDLKGNYQRHNIKTTVKTLALLNESKFHVSDQHIKNGLQNVVKNTGLNGRWQVLQDYPKIICDTAHNKEGLSYVISQLKEEHYNKLHIVFGVVSDKNLDTIISILPKNAIYYFCKPNVIRGLEAEILQSYFVTKGYNGHTYPNVMDALDAAKRAASMEDLIYVGGSTFVVAEVV
ncbi:bifunctional folylpolyglutamate synthase/dihydrofolate synthase [Psychroserpens luteolus]|uniref:bifunctional folylpolyglutamate synthase/dihydrofolate synthase n=1 Tax=Psychroserpens luteolus TaxID=2855840 RepID=UPI001E431366|nr:folylpolyglutamate synthase/dihydrofolate synthase family protein [Psychroserpens luteolus]MCD2259730.1 bifunctional folylpolyglutamate synthase/dihydrofolate synthase [Psychroserpens luteolus]